MTKDMFVYDLNLLWIQHKLNAQNCICSTKIRHTAWHTALSAADGWVFRWKKTDRPDVHES